MDSRRGAAVLEAHAGDHGRRARRRRGPGRQPGARERDPQGQGSLDAEGQHRARDRQGHRRAEATPTAIESVLYEGYGPGGVALLVEALTENRNRTGADVRHIFSKHGGSLGEPGSVAYLFDKKGTIVIDGTRYSEDELMVAIEAGAEDISADEDVFEVVTEPADFSAVRQALEDAGRGDGERRDGLPALEPRADRRAPGGQPDAPDRVARGQRRRERCARQLRHRLPRSSSASPADARPPAGGDPLRRARHAPERTPARCPSRWWRSAAGRSCGT